MTSKNKFGFAPVDQTEARKRTERSPGPMGVAVRDAAETLSETTEAKVAQRRQNAEDARQYRDAKEGGRLLVDLALEKVLTDDLPRDRIDLEEVAVADEMEELKASIKARGQKEPIEVYEDGQGGYQLKKGWRRLTALSQLLAETGDPRFATVVARIETGAADRVLRYIDMVEENVVREDLTFAEMAQVAITAAADPEVPEDDPAELVTRLYGALHKTKRSYIRSFVYLLSSLGDNLRFPRAVARNLGVDVARSIRSEGQVASLASALAACETEEAQTRVLSEYVETAKRASTQPKGKTPPRQKFEFFVGKTKVTARDGEMRIVSDRDFANTPKDVLEAAIAAFEEALLAGSRTR
jgi:ParB family chromosome partitioning protein